MAANENSYSVRFGVISSPLAHLNGDTFAAKLRPGDTSQVSFNVDANAGVSGLKVMGQTFARIK